MAFSDLVFTQLSDPFRIILLIGLVITMARTRAQTGIWVPLAAGIVFVAILIPTTLSAGLTAPLMTQIGAGLLSNAVIVALILAALQLYRRVTK